MEEFFLTHGLWAMGLAILIDDIGLPFFPNGIALFTASSVAASFPELHVWKFFLVAVCAAQLGNGLLFYGGRHGLQKWIRNHNLRFFPSRDRLDKFRKFFSKKHGGLTITALACVTTLRPFAALIAGTSGMNPWKFFSFHFLGILLWGSVVSISGYFMGIPLIHIIKRDGYLGIAIIVVVLAYWYFWSQFPWHCFQKKKK